MSTNDPAAATITEPSPKRGRKPGIPNSEKPAPTSVKISITLAHDSDELSYINDYCELTGATPAAAIKLALLSLENPVDLIEKQMQRKISSASVLTQENPD